MVPPIAERAHRNAQCHESYRCGDGIRYCLTFARGFRARRQRLCRWCRSPRIWCRRHCGQRTRTANGICRSASAGLLRATSSSICRARTGLCGPSLLRATPLPIPSPLNRQAGWVCRTQICGKLLTVGGYSCSQCCQTPLASASARLALGPLVISV